MLLSHLRFKDLFHVCACVWVCVSAFVKPVCLGLHSVRPQHVALSQLEAAGPTGTFSGEL